MKIQVISVGNVGRKLTETQISDTFLVEAKNDQLIAQVVKSHRSKKHSAFANTLDRSQVSGGGKKPWKQKGTGRARVGSSRSPIWTGGGVTFGPNKENNFLLKVPKKMRQIATMVSITDKITSKKTFALQYEQDVKRADFVAAISKYINLGESILFITDNEPQLYKMSRNLPFIQNVGINSINAFDVIKNKNILFSLKSLNAYFK